MSRSTRAAGVGHGSAPTTQAKFFGPWAVRSAFLLAIFGWGVGLHGPPIFLAEAIGRTGWSLSLVSSAVTLHFLCGALATMCIGVGQGIAMLLERV